MIMTRRTLLKAGALGAGLAATPGLSIAARARRTRVLLATNEPWGTYHAQPLLAEAARRGWELVQLVPDRSQITPTDPVPVATLDDVPGGDLLVVSGASDWPADCAAALNRMPLVASSLAYLNPVEAPRAKEFRSRLELVTATSPAESEVFAAYLGWKRRRVRMVGSPQTDNLPDYTPQPDRVLVLTSVTHPDQTGNAAPGTQLLLDSAAKLEAAGKHTSLACTRARTRRCGTGMRSAHSARSQPRRPRSARSESPGPCSRTWRRSAYRWSAAWTPSSRYRTTSSTAARRQSTARSGPGTPSRTRAQQAGVPSSPPLVPSAVRPVVCTPLGTRRSADWAARG
ncbi:hypothetical protein [Kribbella capetownensis]|uniref:hypothetical protein n=1 Tax=Kribbella capetownensis TaxID=1572659 RepID=UPI00192D732E|nr:hypothetical protein [Kribbella capetownensis]